MDSITRLKTQVSLLDHIRKRLGQEGKKENEGFRFKNCPEDKTPSLLVYSDIMRGYCDFGGKLGAGTIIDFDKNFYGKEEKEVIKNLLEEYKIESEKKEFKKSPMWDDLVDNFESFRCIGGNTIFQRFLGTRGVSIDTMKLYKENLQEIAREISTIDGLYMEKGVYKDSIIFPEYDEEENIVGVKIRRADGEKINTKNGEVKSKAHKNIGVLYRKRQLREDIVYICEGETDYIILKMLGFTSLIGNLGGVSSNADKIQKLTKKTQKIISLYDNDEAGRKGTKGLQEKIGRPIRVVQYPKIDGKDKYDINDLFNMGWREEDFQELFESNILLDDMQSLSISGNEISKEHEKALRVMEHRNPIIWLRKHAKFYDYMVGQFRNAQDIPLILGLETKKVNEMFFNGGIEKYYDICYQDGEKEGYFNIFDKNTIARKGKKSVLHPDIKIFLENLGNNKEENYNWLHKVILYKYTHLNDEKVPAVIIHSDQGVGKGTFLNFLKKIFGEENTQEKLSGRSLISGFDTYLGNKMIVEIDELETKGMTEKEIYQLSNRIKSMVFAKSISVNPKNLPEHTVDNLAWFIITSNDIKPLSIEKGDRRYSIIEGGLSLDRIDSMLGARLNDEVFQNQENIENYIAWLFEQFPEVPKMKRLFPLENEDKKYIQRISQNPIEDFFSWFCEKNPDIYKITVKEKKFFVNMYREESGETDRNFDYMYEKSFNKYLPRGVKYGNTSIRGKSPKGYTIEYAKNSGNGYFESEVYEEEEIQKMPF